MRPLISELRFNRLLTRAALLPLLLLAALSALLIWQISHLLGVFQWVGYTNLVIAQANAAQKLTLDLETGKRGYLLSGDPGFLEPYDAAERRVGPALNRLAWVVTDSDAQERRVANIRSLLTRWESDAHSTIARRRTASSAPVLIRDFYGKAQMDAMRGQFQMLIVEEEVLRDVRTRTARTMAQGVIASSILAALGGGILLGLSSRRHLQQLAGEYGQATETMRRQAEDLRQRELRLSTLLRSLGEGVIATDARGCLTLLNPEAEGLTGWRQADAVGRDIRDVLRLRGHEDGEPVIRVLAGRAAFDDEHSGDDLVLLSR